MCVCVWANFLPLQLSCITVKWQVIHWQHNKRKEKHKRNGTRSFPPLIAQFKLRKLMVNTGKKGSTRKTKKLYRFHQKKNHYVMPLVCNCLTPAQRPHCTLPNHTNP